MTPWKYEPLYQPKQVVPHDPESSEVSIEHLNSLLDTFNVFIRSFAVKGDEEQSRSAGLRKEIARLKNPATHRNDQDFQQTKEASKDGIRTKIWDAYQGIWIDRLVNEDKNPRAGDKIGTEFTKKVPAALFGTQLNNAQIFNRGPKNPYLGGLIYDASFVQSNDRYSWRRNVLSYNKPWLWRHDEYTFDGSPPKVHYKVHVRVPDPLNPGKQMIIEEERVTDLSRSQSLAETRQQMIFDDGKNADATAKDGQPRPLSHSEFLIRPQKKAVKGVFTVEDTIRGRLFAFDAAWLVESELDRKVPMVYLSGKKDGRKQITHTDIVSDIKTLLDQPQHSSHQLLQNYFLDGHFQPGSPVANVLLKEISPEDKTTEFKLLHILLNLKNEKPPDHFIEGMLYNLKHPISNAQWPLFYTV